MMERRLRRKSPTNDDIKYSRAIVLTICQLAGSVEFLEDARKLTSSAGLLRAIRTRDNAKIFDYLVAAFSYQGVSDAAAEAYAEKHGNIHWHEIESQLLSQPNCVKLASHWAFDRCGYRKIERTCSMPAAFGKCPLPAHPLRNGRLNQTAYSLFLFFRDVANNDFVEWIDSRIHVAIDDHRPPDYAVIGKSLIEPMRSVFGISDKVISMALSSLLICSKRRHWPEVGGAMIVIDTLVHNLLHRTGVLARLGVSHTFGPACYQPAGCAAIIRDLSARINARAFNPAFPANFPRFVQHALWRYCAQDGFDVCNGNKIDDRRACQNIYCRLFEECDRRTLGRNKPKMREIS